jgi:hypothetical protein
MASFVISGVEPWGSATSKMDLREIGCEMYGTGSGSCSVVGLGISGVEPSDSATRIKINYFKGNHSKYFATLDGYKLKYVSDKRSK